MPHSSNIATLLLGLLMAVPCVSQTAQAFVPNPGPAGTIRIWGDPYMASTVLTWERHFSFYHPEIAFVTQLLGTDTAMGALYTGRADLALLGRESNTTENDGFLHSLQYKPMRLELMTGSLDIAGKSFAPVFFVHKDNPLDRLTLAQADSILGYVQDGRAATTWGDVGLAGAWKTRPIHVYTFDLETGTGIYLLHALQGASKKMNWQIIQEFRDQRRPDGSTYDAAEQTMDALRKDPNGLAVSSLRYVDPNVKALALAATAGGPFVQATTETVAGRSYPLTRSTYAFLNRPPGQPIPSALKEFLRFVFSSEGQGLIDPSQQFLPLNETLRLDQLKQLAQ